MRFVRTNSNDVCFATLSSNSLKAASPFCGIALGMVVGPIDVLAVRKIEQMRGVLFTTCRLFGSSMIALLNFTAHGLRFSSRYNAPD